MKLGVADSPGLSVSIATTLRGASPSRFLSDSDVPCTRKDSVNVTLIITSLNLGHLSRDSEIKRRPLVMSVRKYGRKAPCLLMTPLGLLSAVRARMEIKLPEPSVLRPALQGIAGTLSWGLLRNVTELLLS